MQDGVAEIPISSHDTLGLVYTDNSAGGYTTGLMNQQGRLKVNTAGIDDVNKRRLRKEIDCSNFDYAVKAAMCDGKGAAWTADEQAAARERMGIISEDDFELIATVNPSKEEIVSSMLIDLAEPIKANFYIVCNIGITDKSLNYVNIPRLQLTINDYTTWMYQPLQKNDTELRYMLMQIPICKKMRASFFSEPPQEAQGICRRASCQRIFSFFFLSCFVWNISIDGNVSISRPVIMEYLMQQEIGYGTPKARNRLQAALR